MKRIPTIVYEANPKRSLENLDRRLLKAFEEMGEAVQANLVASSPSSDKDLDWHDFREELIDSLIMIYDLLYTPLPIDGDDSRKKIEKEIVRVFDLKMAKWKKQIEEEKDVTQN